MKNSNFCQHHPKELMRHFCITCVSLICIECIVDHSGHEFVRKEESSKLQQKVTSLSIAYSGIVNAAFLSFTFHNNLLTCYFIP